MSRLLFLSAAVSLAIAAAALGAGLYFWDRPIPDDWTLDSTEHMIPDVPPGQEVFVCFRLRNGSAEPRRILGFDTC